MERELAAYRNGDMRFTYPTITYRKKIKLPD